MKRWGVVLVLALMLSPRASAQEELPVVMRGEVPLRLELGRSSSRPVIHARPSWARSRWARLCVAPCEVRLAPGEYDLAFSDGGEQSPELVAGSWRLSGPRAFRVELESRADARRTGQTILEVAAVPIAIGVGAFLVWALIAGAAAEASPGRTDLVLPELLGPSLGTMALGGIIALFAIPFGTQRDIRRATAVPFE